jgi:DHA3 family macrolide efflux protein-like MFS transporter
MQYKEVFRQPDLVRLWLSQVTSAIGDQLYTIAVIWIAVERGNGDAGFVAAAGTFIGLLLNPIAGVLADRWDRRLTMITVDLLRAAIVLGLVATGQVITLTLVHLAIASMLLSGLGCLFDPSMSGILPELANSKLETLRAMNALMQLNRQLARTIGPGAAGWLATVLPLHHFFSLDAVTFIISAAAIFSISRQRSRSLPSDLTSGAGVNDKLTGAVVETPIDAIVDGAFTEAGGKNGLTSGVYPVRNKSLSEESNKSGVRGILLEMRHGCSLVLEHPKLRWIFAFFVLANIAYGPAVIVGFPLWAKQSTHADLGTYGTLIAFYGAGGCLNIIVAMFKTRRLMFWHCFGWFVFGIGLFVIGRAHDLPLACLGAVITPTGGALMGLMASLIIQTDIPREHLGKVSSLAAFAVCAGDLLGLLFAPFLYSLVCARDGISMCAVIPVAVGIVGMLKFRQGK